MHWIFLGIIVIALLVLARYYPKFGFAMLFGLVLVAALAVIFTENNGATNRSKISASDIVVQNPVISPAYRNNYKINARLINNSSATLRELTLSITLSDCQNQNNNDSNVDDCIVIGQQEKIINTNIPPKQARDIEQLVLFDTVNAIDNPSWNIVVTSTRN